MKKRFFFLIFIFTLNLFIQAGIPASHSSENPFPDGVRFFQTGQFQKSYDLLLKAFEQDPENPDLNFYLGRAAFEIGNYEMAVMTFERILISSPHENRVKLEIARAFQKLGANNTAIQYCQEVLATNPPEAVKNNINAFLAYIKKTEQKHFFNGQLAAGIDWNNNVWASPSVSAIKTIIGDVNLSGASSKKTQDWIYNTTIGIQHAFDMPLSDDFWKTDATLYTAVYDKTSALDISYFGTSTGPEFVFSKDKIGIRFFFNHIDLGNSPYQDGLGLKLQSEHMFNPGFLSHATVKIEEKDYKDIPGKDAKNISLGFDINYLFKNCWIDIGVKAEKENAADSEYSYKRYGSDLSIFRELPFKTTGSASYAYQYSRYLKPGSLFTKSREDHQHSAGAGLKKILWRASDNPGQTVSLNFNYQHVWAFSNIDLYDYEQDLFQMFLLYTF